jgi:hypothetical protein
VAALPLLSLSGIARALWRARFRSPPVTRIVAHASVLFIFIRFSWAAAPWPALAQRPGPRPGPQDAAPASPEPIGKIRVDEMLQPVVSMLLAKSETFRRQWQIINASRFIRVTVVWRFGLQETHSARARTEVTHYEYGSIRAIIEVPAGTDLTELLPHELEHVIEQLEGLDLAALARQHGEGVVEVRKGIYESARARAAGLQVYREVYGETDPAVRPRLAGSGGPGRRQTPANRAPKQRPGHAAGPAGHLHKRW